MIYKSVEICLIPLGTDFFNAKCAKKINHQSLEMVLLYDFRRFFNRKVRKDLRKVHKENKSSIVRNGSTL